MYTAPSYKAFNTFCNMCEVGLDEDDPIINMETHLIPDDENEDCQEPLHQPEAPDTSSQGVDWSHPPNTPVSFDLDATDRTDLPVVIDDEEDTAVHENPAAEFLRWHHKLNHMSAAKMQSMAKRGLLEEVGQVPSSNLHQLLIWKGHQKTMENQAKGWSTRWKTSNSLRAGTVHQHRSVGVQYSRAHCPNQGLAHQEKVQGGNNLCGSLQWFVLHPPSEVNQCR
ncbi:hypothetical protein MHU86_4885 [Fragilaria crotonensis]|nr:hypothetical protein MHU86_4885 [Fragilaria crotonensis]